MVVCASGWEFGDQNAGDEEAYLRVVSAHAKRKEEVGAILPYSQDYHLSMGVCVPVCQ
jgi:hypothetical protein